MVTRSVSESEIGKILHLYCCKQDTIEGNVLKRFDYLILRLHYSFSLLLF